MVYGRIKARLKAFCSLASVEKSRLSARSSLVEELRNPQIPLVGDWSARVKTYLSNETASP